MSTTAALTPVESQPPLVPPESMPATVVQPKTFAAPTLVGTRNGWPTRVIYFGCDLAGIGLSLAAAHLLLAVCSVRVPLAFTLTEFKLFSLYAAGLLGFVAFQGAYAAVPPRHILQFRNWVVGSFLIATLVILSSLWLQAAGLVGSLEIALAAGLAMLVAPFNRAMCRNRFARRSWWGTRVLVIGTGHQAADAYRALADQPQWGLRPLGYVDDEEEDSVAGNSAGRLGSLDNLHRLTEQLHVHRAVAAVHGFDAGEIASLISRPNSGIRHWVFLPPLARFPCLWLQACEVAGLPAFSMTNHLTSPIPCRFKRAFDVLTILVAAPLVAPLVALLALLVRLSSPGPAFYSHERIGLHGRRFKAWKFRTMFKDADQVLERCLEESPELREEWAKDRKLKRDPRVTWIGHWLRISSLDELPQLWNVLRGEMSLVGPRPIVEAEIDKYAEHYEQYMQVLPGITGLWQVSGRNNTTYGQRVSYDAYYVRNWSPWLDIYILACTVRVVLLGEGAY